MPDAGPGAPGITVLYVDDEPALLGLTRRFLERSGDCSVTTALSAPAAIQLLSQQHYDVIVSDYQMPDMDGISFLRHLRENGDTTPFIIFTGRGREDVVIEALNYGADFYIQKGGDPNSQFLELAHKVRHAVSRRRAERNLQQHHVELLAANEQLAAAEEELRHQVDEIAAAERALRESRNRYQGIFENTGSGMLIIGNDTTITLVNTAFERLSGYTRRELEGKMSWTVFVHPDDRERMLSFHRKRRTDPAGAPGQYEFRFIDRQGTMREMHLTIGIIPETDQSVASLIDIADRKRAEEDRRILAQMVDAAPSLITVHDLEGRFLYANQRTYDLHGYSPEEFHALNLCQLDTPASADLIRTRIQHLLDFGEASFEVMHQRKDGTTFPLLVHARVVTWADTPALLIVAEDITDRKQAEEALRTANRKLNLISRITRHDISNQLGALDGFLELLRSDMPDTATDDYFARIREASARIAGMIRFASTYEEIGINAPVWHDIRGLVKTAGNDCATHDILLENNLPAGSELFADPLIMRVFYNLFENAVRYGETVTGIRVSGERTGRDYRIICEDDGVGIPAGEKEKIFDRGYGKNTGLGLFLARDILAITGITICETGQPGKGARFEIMVPDGCHRVPPGL
ncbi:MAG TPA: PAS domain S-box protein [Methanoregulaceae archaeon]|nr:PAS domain S-box protein [Methanoregulaceae archaeon]